MKQLGLAYQNYVAKKQYAPPGYLGPPVQPPTAINTVDDQYVGVIPFILPEMERQDVYDQITTDLRVTRPQFGPFPQPWWTNPNTFLVAQTRLNILLCPTATEEQYLPAYVQSHMWYDSSVPEEFQYVARRDVDNFPPGVPELGRTNYLGCAGVAGNLGTTSTLTPIAANLDKFEGIFSSRSRTAGGAIRDGASNTFLFGESVGQENANQVLVANHSWMGSNIAITYFGLRPLAPAPKRQYNNFSSYHGVVQFTFADGSVKGIAEETDLAVLWAYSGKSDKVVIPDQN
jgi:hypothetical protein